MTPTPTTLPVPVRRDFLADSLDHVVCCADEDTALCGVDVTGQPWISLDAAPHPCTVCVLMEESGCCGRDHDCAA